MKLSFKIVVALLSGVIALGALLYFQFFSNHYFSKRQHISEQINAIETVEKSLDYEVLRSGFFLYYNQDDIIRKVDIAEEMIHTLKNDLHFINEHPQTLKTLETYHKAFQNKTDAIYDFQTANSAIKNATMTIPILKQQAISAFDTGEKKERLFLEDMTKIGGSILLAKNSLDSQLIGELDNHIKMIQCHRFKEERQQQICIALIGNLKVFRDFFPLYKQSIDTLENSNTKAALNAVRKSFLYEDSTELHTVKYFSYLLVALYISSLGLIIYFLIRSEIESRTDRLTGLGNRKGYEIRIRRKTPSALFLVNINKFKNYNDFYGIAAGDQILSMTARRLKELCHSWDDAALYRLGGDEFGIVIEYNKSLNLEIFGKILLEEFHKQPMTIEEIETSLSICMAISIHTPLLETADMALKSIKKDRNKDLIIYHEGLNLLQVVQENITKTHELRHAVEHDRLIPHFQPIVSLSSGQIEKYEVLARLVTQEGEIKSIVDYLDVVKESKYYPTLTKIMVQKSFAVMKTLSYEFSINLSIDDITDSETVHMIETTLNEHPEIASHVVFEILESEAMDDYTKVADFIHIVKKYGCKIAIDDFGSGYSNFDHLLNLDIDIIKLDGSIIQHIDISPHAVMIVETIVNFAKKAGIKTIAEFVCDHAVYEKVKELGIDYAQGYYNGKPEAMP